MLPFLFLFLNDGSQLWFSVCLSVCLCLSICLSLSLIRRWGSLGEAWREGYNNNVEELYACWRHAYEEPEACFYSVQLWLGIIMSWDRFLSRMLLFLTWYFFSGQSVERTSRGQCLVLFSLSFTPILFLKLCPITLFHVIVSQMTTSCTNLATLLNFLKLFIQLSLVSLM